MGSSSKKHKDKERESRKRHHRNRSKSREREKPPGERRPREKRRDPEDKRSRDPKDRDKKRLKESAPEEHRSGDRSRPRDESRNFDDIKPKSSGGDISLSIEDTNKVRARLGLKPLEDKNAAPEVKVKSSGGEISLSVEDTNKVRAKLGLKPLEESGSAASTGEQGDKQEFVHKPAENLSNKRFVERLREKVALQKEKRIINKKLSNVKGLADSDSDDDVSNWVQKNRVLAAEKLKAQQRAKLLEEMDEEFGVGSLVEDEFNAVKAKAYSARDLKGLKVEHSQRSFAEGQTVVLTLKDKGVLDEEEDALVNQNMIDKEKANKNVIRKKAKPGYVPFEEEEDEDDDEEDYLQELKTAQAKNLLNKYDEEIDGERKKSFVLGAKGVTKTASERELIRQKLRQKQGAVSLDSTTKLASEYYTEEEMVKFKKPVKKVRKEKRSKKLRADDLLALQEAYGSVASASISDLGSRRGSRKSPRSDDKPLKSAMKKPRMAIPEFKPDPDCMEIDPPDYMDEPEILGPEEDLTGYQVETDEAEIELQLVLAKSRLIKDRNTSSGRDDKILEHVRSFHCKQESNMSEESDDDNEDGQGRSGNDPNNKSSIVLNSTAEFCRALGDIPTYGMSGNRDEDVEEMMNYDREQLDEKVPMLVDDGTARGAWNEVEAAEEEEEGSPVKIKKEDLTILDEEPVVGSGMAGALQLATKKGYLDNEAKKVMGAPRHSVLQATSYTIEDKAFLEDDRLGRRERFSAGPVSDFKDKEGYRPDVKLEYIDDSGRLLNSKEAFRYLSHKFHGKGSGKNKTEKRMKKLQEENLMKQMSSTDTPLGTLNLLQEKQRQTQSPYILLSGGSKALNASSISKAK